MKKKVKWTYEANWDYLQRIDEENWIIGFLDDEGIPYECPLIKDKKLIEKVKEIDKRNPSCRVKATVETDEKPDELGQQHPVLIEIEETKETPK